MRLAGERMRDALHNGRSVCATAPENSDNATSDLLEGAAGSGLLEARLWPMLTPMDLAHLFAAAAVHASRSRVPGAFEPWCDTWRQWHQWRSLHQMVEASDLEGTWARLQADDLLAKGAGFLDEHDEFALTALHYAAQSGADRVVRLLLAAKADVQARYFAVNARNGCYPLHLAAHKGSTKCVRALLAARSEVDAVDGACRTALHYARTAGRADVVQTLVNAGARGDEDILVDEERINEAAVADDGSPRSLRAAWAQRRRAELRQFYAVSQEMYP